MPVDRVKRDIAAHALVSFLRGEADRAALLAVFKRLAQASELEGEENLGKDTYLEELLAVELTVGERHRPVTEELWFAMCRHLAFLKSDLDERPWPNRDHEYQEEEDYAILLARRHTLGLLVAFGVAYLTSWWLLAAATVVSLPLYLASSWKHDLLKNEERRKEMKPRLQYRPFADQADWLAHKHILDEFHLPAYDANAFGEPPPIKKWPAIVIVSIRWTWYLINAAMISFMYLFSIVFWPVWLVMMSLRSRGTGRQQQVTS